MEAGTGEEDLVVDRGGNAAAQMTCMQPGGFANNPSIAIAVMEFQQTVCLEELKRGMVHILELESFGRTTSVESYVNGWALAFHVKVELNADSGIVGFAHHFEPFGVAVFEKIVEGIHVDIIQFKVHQGLFESVFVVATVVAMTVYAVIAYTTWHVIAISFQDSTGYESGGEGRAVCAEADEDRDVVQNKFTEFIYSSAILLTSVVPGDEQELRRILVILNLGIERLDITLD